MSSLYRRGAVYWLKWYSGIDKKHHAKALLYPDGRKVRNRRDALYFKAEEDKHLAVGVQLNGSGITLEQAIASYLKATATQRGKAWDATTRHYLRLLNQALGSPQLQALTPLQVESAVNQIAQERKLRAKSRGDYLAAARAFSRWCVARGFALQDFTRHLKRPASDERERSFLTAVQRDAILKRARPTAQYPVICAAFYTGARWKEIITLEWTDIDFTAKCLQIRPQHAKTKRARIIPLHPKLEEVLRPRRQIKGPVFGPTTRWTYQTFLAELQGWFKAEDIRGERLGFHTCRHTFETLLLLEGVSIWKVAEWAGHSVEVLQKRYAHRLPVYDADIARA